MRTSKLDRVAWLLAHGFKPKAWARMEQENMHPRTVWIFDNSPELMAALEALRVSQVTQNALRLMGRLRAACADYAMNGALHPDSAAQLPMLVGIPETSNEVRYRQGEGHPVFAPAFSVDNACCWIIREAYKRNGLGLHQMRRALLEDNSRRFPLLRSGQRFVARSIAPATLASALAMLEGPDLLGHALPVLRVTYCDGQDPTGEIRSED